MANVRTDEVQVNVNVNGLNAGTKLKEIKSEAAQLRKELAGLAVGSEEFNKKLVELAEKQAVLDSVGSEIKRISNELNNAGNGFTDFLKKAAAIAGLTVLFDNLVGYLKQFGQASIQAAAQNSDALADMQKATGLTKEEVAALNDELGKIDTRTTQEALQDITVVGGQLGVAKDEIEGFVETMDKAVVALGDEFPGGAEETSKALGTLKLLFKETKDLKYGDALNQIGSAINALGAAGSATGPVMSDFAARVGQLGGLAPTIDQTLGLAATLQELGLSSEIGASGLGQILMTGTKETAAYAKQLGLTKQQFKDLINTNPNGVILQLAKSLEGASNTKIVATLEGLNIKSQEAVKVISALSNNTTLLEKRQALANVELKKATSLTDEFNVKNNTEAAQLAKAEKQFKALQVEVGQRLIPTYIKLLQAGGMFIDVLRALPSFIEQNKGLLIGLAIALVGFNYQLIQSNALALKDVAMKQLQSLWALRTTLTQQGLNAAMRANPIGIVITLVGLLVAGFMALYENSQTVRAGIAGLGAVAKEVFTIIKEAVGSFVSGFQKLKSGDIAGGLADFGKGIIKSNPVGIAFSEGGRLASAFNKGFDDKVSSEKTPVTKKVTVKTTTEGAGPGAAAGTGTGATGDDPLTKKEQKEEARRQKAAAKEAKEREKDNQERLKAEADAAKQLEDLQIQAIENESLRKSAAAAAAAEREINEVNRSQATAQQKADLVKAIDTKLQLDLAAIDREANEKKLKEQAEADKKLLELKNKAVAAEADLDILLAGKNADKLLAARIAKVETLRDIELQNTELTEQEKLLIKTRAENEIDGLREENAQKERDRQQEFIDLGAQLTQGGLQAISDFSSIAANKELATADRNKNAKIQKLDQELKAKKITQEQYDAAKSQAEAEADRKTTEIKRKQADTDKKVALGQAIIAGALGVTKALPNIPLAVATGLLAALNIAKIAATPVQYANGGLLNWAGQGIKKLAKGGLNFFRNAGIPKGPSHAQGGIDLVDNTTGKTLAEMEGGEPIMVLSKNTYANNSDVVDRLLDSSLYGNGRRIKMADGGLVGADGAGSGQAASGSEAAMLGLLAGIERNTANFPTRVKGIWVLSELQDAQTLNDQIEEDANF